MSDSFYQHPRYNCFLEAIADLKTDARINLNALNFAFDEWLAEQKKLKLTLKRRY